MTGDVYTALQALAHAPFVVAVVVMIALVLVGCSVEERRDR